MRIKYIWISLLLLVAWGIAGILSRGIGSGIVGYVAFNYTNSYVLPTKFEWDDSLKTAIYSMYLFIFILISVIVIVLRKKSKSLKMNKFYQLLFIAVFPCQTSWAVHTNCGFNGCDIAREYSVMVPTIMSTELISIITSASVAYVIFQLITYKLNAKA